MRRAVALAAWCAAAILATGCEGDPAPGASQAPAASSAPPASASPEERWAEVSSDVAPLVSSLEERDAPADPVRRGELVIVGDRRGEHGWGGLLEGARVRRDGPVHEARRTANSRSFVFQSDVGPEVRVRSAAALCGDLAARLRIEAAACKGNLRRARAADGAIVSYHPCSSGPCPVAIERGGELGAIAIADLTGARFVWGKKRSVLVAETRYVREEGKLTGGRLVIVSLDGAEPALGREIIADAIDARDPSRIVARVVAVTVTRGEISLQGEIEEKSPDGKVLSKKIVDEHHRLPDLD